MSPRNKQIIMTIAYPILFLIVFIILSLSGEWSVPKVDPGANTEITEADWKLAGRITDVQLLTVNVLLEHKEQYEKELGLDN